jgi:hypothetical protein
MTDLANIETAAKQEVATVKSKVVAFVKAHIPHTVAAVVGYVSGHYGLIGAVLKHLF